MAALPLSGCGIPFLDTITPEEAAEQEREHLRESAERSRELDESIKKDAEEIVPEQGGNCAAIMLDENGKCRGWRNEAQTFEPATCGKFYV